MILLILLMFSSLAIAEDSSKAIKRGSPESANSGPTYKSVSEKDVPKDVKVDDLSLAKIQGMEKDQTILDFKYKDGQRYLQGLVDEFNKSVTEKNKLIDSLFTANKMSKEKFDLDTKSGEFKPKPAKPEK